MPSTRGLAVAPVTAVEPAGERYERLPRPPGGRGTHVRAAAGPHISPCARLQVFMSPAQAGGTPVDPMAEIRAGRSSVSRTVESRPGWTGPVRRGCGSPPCTTPTATGSP